MKPRFLIFLPLFVAMLLTGCISLFTPGFGTLSITSVPSHGRVFLDDQDTGEFTPVVLQRVPAGVHSVRVEVPGMQPATGIVVVPRDGSVTLDLTLTQPLLSGFVLSSARGSAVPDATVTLYEAGTKIEVASTRTDAYGAYRFHGIPDGWYDVVATKETRAEAKVQSVRVDNGSPVSVDLFQRRKFDPTKGASAPTIRISGLQPGDVISEPTTVTVEVEGDFPIDRVRVFIGKVHDDNPFDDVKEVYEFTVTLDVTLDPARYPNGATFVAIDVYDVQFNWTQWIIPIEFRNQGPVINLPRVKDVSLHAITHGVDVGLFRLQHAELHETLQLSGDADLFVLHDGTVINLRELRQDVSLYVNISWPRVEGAFGYEVQRAWSASGPWKTLGYRWAHESTDSTYEFVDGDGSLVPGREVYYRVRALGPNGEMGEFSTPVAVTPLERFEVWLVAPADGSLEVPLRPVLRWAHNGVGSNHYFEGYVRQVTGSPETFTVWEFADENIVEAPFNYDGKAVQPLMPGTQYRWNIYLAYAYTLYGTNSKATAYSLRGARTQNGEWIGGGAINGEFVFVTTFAAEGSDPQ